MARAVDRYSFFVPPEMVGLFIKGMSDTYVGIGIQIDRTAEGDIEVISTTPDGPAFKAGLRPKDLVVAVDGKQTKNMPFIEVLKFISDIGHSAGSKVELSVTRKEAGNLEFPLTRELLQRKTVEWRIVDQCFGYVRVTQFGKNTVPDFKKAIHDMEQNNFTSRGLIVDLRNNPGGDGQAAIELARLFLDSGTVASMESNFPGYNLKFNAEKGSLYDRPVAILVDEGSASASELFAGALQRNGRAKLVGRRTYGKNACQAFWPISDDAGFYLTIGRFFLPDGSTIEGKGLLPDVVVERNTGEEEVLCKAIRLLKRQ